MTDQKDQEAYEEQSVHEVYQQIAQHFSSTRYKVCLPLSCLFICSVTYVALSHGPSLNASCKICLLVRLGLMWAVAMASIWV